MRTLGAWQCASYDVREYVYVACMSMCMCVYVYVNLSNIQGSEASILNVTLGSSAPQCVPWAPGSASYGVREYVYVRVCMGVALNVTFGSSAPECAP